MTIADRSTGEDRGSTLVVAMMVMGVAVALSLLVVNVAIGTGRTTGGDRQRLTAVGAAEAGVDAAFAKIQRSGVLLPCAYPDSGTQSMKLATDRAVSAATIVYTGASGATGCPLAVGDVPVQAVITGTGTTSGGKTRRIESLVHLKPVPGDGLDKGMFGDQGVSLDQNATVSAGPGERVDVYSNGNFSCSNSPTFQGSIIAPLGSITMLQTCAATGDVWARDGILLGGNKTIGGRVLSAGAGITADSNTSVNGTLMARGNINWSNCSMAGKCLSNQTAVPVPPVSVFPEILRSAKAAYAAGPKNYEIVPLPSHSDGTTSLCGAAAGDWLKARMSALTRNTLYTSGCNVEFANTRETNVSRDVAVFADGGVSTSNQVKIGSHDGQPHDVSFIQPFDTAPRPCERVSPYPVMGPTQLFSSTEHINLLWYSPCNISYGNQGGSFGQIYSGSTLTTNNSYALTFRRVDIFGISNLSTTTTSYAVDIVYKRETR